MATQSIIETRRAQMFPTLSEAEVERLRRFGEVRRFAAGETLVRTGDTGHGLTLFLSGEVEISQRDRDGGKAPIVVHGPGSAGPGMTFDRGVTGFTRGSAEAKSNSVMRAPQPRDRRVGAVITISDTSPISELHTPPCRAPLFIEGILEGGH